MTLYGTWRSFRRRLRRLNPLREGRQFCPGRKCVHYGQTIKYARKCYYAGPQCWRGFLDLMLQDIRLLIRIRLRRTEHSDLAIMEVGD